MENFYQKYDQIFVILTPTMAAFGACVGSFLNVIIWRLPRHENVIRIASHCTTCGHKIPFWCNIPVVSWLSLVGRCRFCKTRIPIRYFAVEAITMLLIFSVWMQGWRMWWAYEQHMVPGFWPMSLVWNYIFLVSLLVAIAVIDIDHRIVPDSLVILGIVGALLIAWFFPASHELVNNPNHSDSLRHKPVLYILTEALGGRFPILLKSNKVLAVVDSLLGVLFGGGLIWLLSELGKLLRGRTTIKTDEPATVKLTSTGYDTPDEGFVEWEDTFIRRRDTLIVKGQIIGIQLTPNAKSVLPLELGETGEIRVKEDGVRLGELVIPLEEIDEMTINSQEWTIPLEPMGLGDATMMGMIGAFVGAGAILPILAIASVLGTLGGLAKIFAKGSKLYSSIAFGPFIAAATYIYFMFDDQILGAWWRLFQLFQGNGN